MGKKVLLGRKYRCASGMVLFSGFEINCMYVQVWVYFWILRYKMKSWLEIGDDKWLLLQSVYIAKHLIIASFARPAKQEQVDSKLRSSVERSSLYGREYVKSNSIWLLPIRHSLSSSEIFTSDTRRKWTISRSDWFWGGGIKAGILFRAPYCCCMKAPAYTGSSA